jgi:glucokinase
MFRLIADIGGTNARFAIAGPKGIEHTQILNCKDYPSLADAAKTYLKAVRQPLPEDGAFAVAAPLDGGDHVKMPNHVWAFSIKDTAVQVGLKKLKVVNDFAALGYAVPRLTSQEYFQVGGGTQRAGMPIVVVGPGTGLGVGGIVFMGDQAVVIPTEGGHVTMPASSDREFRIFEQLKKDKYSHVSAERVVSGKGILNMYHAIAALDGVAVPERTPAEITDAGVKGSCKVCAEVIELFCHFLGVVAGNAALTYGAGGGVYIAGGIVPQIKDYFIASRFRASFTDKGRFKDYLNAIPTFVITHPTPGLEGLKYVL